MERGITLLLVGLMRGNKYHLSINTTMHHQVMSSICHTNYWGHAGIKDHPWQNWMGPYVHTCHKWHRTLCPWDLLSTLAKLNRTLCPHLSQMARDLLSMGAFVHPGKTGLDLMPTPIRNGTGLYVHGSFCPAPTMQYVPCWSRQDPWTPWRACKGHLSDGGAPRHPGTWKHTGRLSCLAQIYYTALSSRYSSM